MKTLRTIVIAAVVLCSACPRTVGTGGTTSGAVAGGGPSSVTVPDEVTDQTYSRLVRELRSAAVGTPGRVELRRVLVAHAAGRFREAMEAREPDRAWDIFADVVDLYEPEELRAGGLEPEVATMAQQALDVYEPRGDEARVLAALQVLAAGGGGEGEAEARYAEVARWSEEAREALPSDAERVLGLIDTYERVADVMPAQEPVDRLAYLYLRRDELLRSTFGGPMGLSALLSPGRSSELQSLLASRGRTVMDIVALFLRAGRTDEVRRTVAALGSLASTDRDLIRATRDLESERRGARARATLAAALGRDHPRVALRLCHEGRRLYPQDRTFLICLAELYRSVGDSEGALDYYEQTLELDSSLEAFEVALQFVAMELEVQLADEDPRGARQVFERAGRMLALFEQRYPGREPPIREDQLSYLVGMGEFNAGNIDEAAERLRASVERHTSRPALVQLGIIAERRGQMQDAIRYYREALDLREGSQENPLSRAMVLVHLAEAHRGAGESSRAEALFGEALLMLAEAGRVMPADVLPAVRTESGFVLHELGRDAEAEEQLRQALQSAPERDGLYGQILSFYVGRGMVREAADVYHQAFNNSGIDRMWKVYFSMWLVGLQRRLGQEPDQTAVSFLESVRGDEWIDRLGRFYAGTLPYSELLDSAESRGQRAEAYYYEAVLRLAAGRRDEAEALLRQVIETNMMGYFEYEFARRLQDELAAGGASRAVAPEMR